MRTWASAQSAPARLAQEGLTREQRRGETSYKRVIRTDLSPGDTHTLRSCSDGVCSRGSGGTRGCSSCQGRPAGEGDFGKDVSVPFASPKLPRNLVSRSAAYTFTKLNPCLRDAFGMMRPELLSLTHRAAPAQPRHGAQGTSGLQVRDNPPDTHVSPERWHFPTPPRDTHQGSVGDTPALSLSLPRGL